MCALDGAIQTSIAWFFLCAIMCIYNLHMALLFCLVPSPCGDAPWTGGAVCKVSTLAIDCFYSWKQHCFKCSSVYHSVRLFGLGNWAPWTLVPRRHPSWSFSTARAGEAEQRNSSQFQWTERHNWLWRMAPTIPGSVRAWLHSNDKRSCLPHWASVWAENVGMIIWTEMITIALINMKQNAI